MNLVLFEPTELESALVATDPRFLHITRVLRRRVGDTFDCGEVNAAIGKATIENIDASGMRLRFEWIRDSPPLYPITFVIGLVRPQTVRKILGALTAMGVARMHFFRSARSEASYAASRLWTSGEVRRHLIDAAQQAFSTRLPEVLLSENLPRCLEGCAAGDSRLALDVYEPALSASRLAVPAGPATVAIGPERGWTDEERKLLQKNGFALAHLGPRVLRTETACVVAATLIEEKLGFL